MMSEKKWLQLNYYSLLTLLQNQLQTINPYMDSIKNWFNSKFTPSEKDFETMGVLSPQQFVQAGDQLTNFGWTWQKSLNKKNKLLDNPDKQFLMSKATSNMRIQHLLKQQEIVEQLNQQTGFFEVKKSEQKPHFADNEELFRYYTVYITYDEYYHSPRLWLQGTNIQGTPLTAKQIFEDINSQYQNETVTQQTMPYIQCRMLTIHPCKHSQVLKRFIQSSSQRGKKIKPHMSLLIFLKFMSSVMPTVRYDHTVDVQI